MACGTTNRNAGGKFSSAPVSINGNTRWNDPMLATSLQEIKATKSLLEWQLINGFLEEEGYCLKDLKTLPDDVSRRLLIEACTFASEKMVGI